MKVLGWVLLVSAAVMLVFQIVRLTRALFCKKRELDQFEDQIVEAEASGSDDSEEV